MHTFECISFALPFHNNTKNSISFSFVHCAFICPTHLERDGLEVVLHPVPAVGIAAVDNESAQQRHLGDSLPKSRLLNRAIDFSQQQIADHIVHLVGDHGNEGVLVGPVQILPLHPGAEVANDEVLLHVGLGGLVGESLELGSGQVGHELLLALGLDGLVGAEGGAARAAGLLHPHPFYLPNDSFGGDAHVGTVDDDDVSVLGAVGEEGAEARGTDEGDAAETAEIEHAAAVGLGQAALQAGEEGQVGVVDLVAAQRGGQEGVVRLISSGLEGADDPLGHLGVGEGGGEVLAARLLEGGIVRDGRGGLGIDREGRREAGSDQRGRDGRQGRLDASIAGREGHIILGSASGMEARARARARSRRHRLRRRPGAGREGRGGQRQKDQRGELHLCKNDGLFSSLPVEQRAGNDTRTGTQLIWQQATAATNLAVK